MECQASDSKKVLKVFEATKRKRTRKKHEVLEDWQSVASEKSNDRRGAISRHVSPTRGSLHELAKSPNRKLAEDLHGKGVKERHSDQSVHNSHQGERHRSRSRRHRRAPREEVSLALRAGLVSTPRSISPHQNGKDGLGATPHDDSSFMEGLLQEAIKQDRRKLRQSRRREENVSRDRRDTSRERRHRRHRDEQEKETKTKKKEKPSIDQAVLETFIKLCSQMQVNPGHVTRTHSNKSLQCDESRHHVRDYCQRSREASKHNLSPTRIRSHDDCRKMQPRDRNTVVDGGIQTGCDPYEKSRSRYASRLYVNDIDDRRCPLKVSPTRCHVLVHERSSDEYDRKTVIPYEDRRILGQRMSRSFDVQRDCDRTYRRSARDRVKDRSFDSGYRDKIYEDRRQKYKDYYDPRDYRESTKQNRLYRSPNIDFDRASIVSTDDFRNREKYVERDSGLSVADDTSTASCKSDYLRVVKQEITEQREAMDKMMKLWKELMRAFKGPESRREPTKLVVETTANVRSSAAAQLQLWRECMRRYETVARDVGDTDARLMEEINKQRSEMAEMTSMFQECLRRYKDMTDDFNTLKLQLQSESPVRLPAPYPSPSPAPCTGDGAPSYRLPPYPPPMSGVPMMSYPPARAQVSAPCPPAPPPAACCWGAGGERGYSPRRRSSPETRACRDHRHRDRGESRCKEKSKPGGSKSEHRHRKR
ncbi:serine/threonine-protein kinase PRP4 homolog [Aricia agestis]|uniref:serine/threonine-protein kinase PRP4 homolog n=1 Tax=Aricia agestis TaxID=91739 RepID=UPI001C2032E1|nr:serine/threonine-protein kinase PRP4 homolog [Aricia agestis]